MCHPALQEPAILYLILKKLPQHDLLISQRVSRIWRATVTSSKALQAQLFNRPDLDEDQDTPRQTIVLNPLLKERFSGFFPGFSTIKFHRQEPATSNPGDGPWHFSHWVKGRGKYLDHRRLYKEDKTMEPNRCAAYKRTEASWRRMIPCKPAPLELQVHFAGRSWLDSSDSLRCLLFPNSKDDPEGDVDSRRPPWLTFGLLHDVTESAWMRGTPERVYLLAIEIEPNNPAPTIQKETGRLNRMVRIDGPWRDQMQQRFQSKQICGPGRVCLDFVIDQSTEKEREDKEEEEEGAKQAVLETRKRMEPRIRELIEKCRKKGVRIPQRVPLAPEPSRDKNMKRFMVREDRAATDIAWDEILECKL